VYALTSAAFAASGSNDSASAHMSFSTRLSPEAFDAEHPREHALHVAVEDRRARAVRERRDRGGRRAADARQLGKPVRRRREYAAVLGDDDLRAAMQIARARVVAEAGPQRHHVVGRRRERGDVGKRSRKRV
jgi:hypothetical protein